MGILRVTVWNDDDVVYDGEVDEKNVQLLYGEDGMVRDCVFVLHTTSIDLELEGVERIWRDDTDQLVRAVHAPAQCVGRPCCIHAPSNHHMKDWPRHWRFDRHMMERICEHGIGHPDPDDATFQMENAPDAYSGVHGCDGCCSGLPRAEWQEKIRLAREEQSR